MHYKTKKRYHIDALLIRNFKMFYLSNENFNL
jgi:hypothetical protein